MPRAPSLNIAAERATIGTPSFPRMIEPKRTYQHYEVLRRGDGSPWELGRGAMGITYKAFDVNLCCEVALKVVNSALLDHPSARERFVREARAAAALRHRNVASVYHLGNDGEHFFYAMEFIDGETLDALVRRQGPLPVPAVLRVILQVSKALVAADRQHLVHRDIKPTNLMIVHEDADEDMTIKVIDFGLARPSAESSSTAQLTIGGFVGTPQYASPEQLEEQPLDARSDIYSLGVTAWYLLTGHPPFTGSLAAVCQQQLSKPPPWDQLPSGTPEAVRSLLAQMLEKQPGNRPQNARELRGRIEACLEELPREPWLLPPHGSPGRSVQAPGTTIPGTREGARPSASEFGGGRYTVVRAITEGPGSTVYQARDETNGRSVVVRTLPAVLTGDPSQREKLSEDVRLIQAAPHPHLTQILALDAGSAEGPAFLVEEFRPGFSLRDLLAARGGRLSLVETLHLLEQAAAAADHAESRRLEHLELGLHEVCVHWPSLRSIAPDPSTDTVVPTAKEAGTNGELKIHPFSTEHAGEEHGTWAGDMTIVPGLGANGTQGRPVGKPYLRALAFIAYELLGGPPTTGMGPCLSTFRSMVLPALNEAANVVLAQAVSAPESFASCHDFYRALAGAAAVSRRTEEPPASSLLLPTLDLDTDDVAELPPSAPERSDVAEAPPLPAHLGSTAFHDFHPGAAADLPEETESVAGFFQHPEEPSSDTPTGQIEGSAWERLSMVGGEPVRPGRWLLGAVGVTVLFVAVVAGVLAFLLQGDGARSGPSAPAGRTRATGVAPVQPANVRPVPTSTPAAARMNEATSSPPVTPVATVAPVIVVRDVPPGPLDHPAASGRVASEGTQPTLAAPAEKQVAVSINSLPSGAEVRLNGELLGTTPFATQLPPGDHDLIAARPGSLPTHRTVHLEPGQKNATTEIRLMSPNLVPSNLTFEGLRTEKPPRSTSSERGARTPSPTGVESAVSVAGPSVNVTVPVRRPLPLEPFERAANRTSPRPVASPVPSTVEDDSD